MPTLLLLPISRLFGAVSNIVTKILYTVQVNPMMSMVFARYPNECSPARKFMRAS